MALELNFTTLATAVDSTNDQIRNDFRVGIADKTITQSGSQTFYVASAVVAASPMDIWPQVTLGANERLAIYLIASYGSGDDTAAKRLITLEVDTHTISADLTYLVSTQATTSLTINRSATAASTAVIQMLWHVVSA